MIKTVAVVLNYFSSDLTYKAVQSVIDQVTLVAVVDNSNDSEQRTRLEVYYSGHKSVLLFFPSGNLGFAAGVNFALEKVMMESVFDYILLLNSDCVVNEISVSSLIKAVSTHEDNAASAPVNIGKGLASEMWYHRATGIISQRAIPGAFSYLTGACLLVPTKLVRSTKLFDEDFFMYGEDVELSWRIRQKGGRLIVAHDAVCDHLGNSSVSLGSHFYEYHTARGQMLLASKLSGNPREKILLAAGHVGYLLLRALVRALRFRSAVPVQALFSVFSGVRR